MMCAYKKDSPRISAIDICDWIHTKIQFPVVQIDGIRRHVYIKLRDPRILEDAIAQNNGALTYEHHKGVVSNVAVSMASLGKRRIRIANLPPELRAATIHRIMGKYGTVHEIGRKGSPPRIDIR